MNLQINVKFLKGVGPELVKKLALLGIKTVDDLVGSFPRRYVDYSKVVSIAELRPGEVTLQAKIVSVTGRYVRRGMHITEAIATDATGSTKLVWFNQPYRAASIKPTHQYYISGEFALRSGRFGIVNPSVELVSDFPINTARIIPIYRETKGLKSFQIRKLIRQAADHVKDIPDHLPSWILKKNNLIDYKTAALEMHFPSGVEELERAKTRLGFEEIFQLSLAALLNKQDVAHEKGLKIPFNKDLAQSFVKKLPYKLTDAQRRAIWQIYLDLDKTQPMNRLLEGDVGSGKTVVAAMAALMAIDQGFQVALMAPTEILARQHAKTIYDLLSNIGLSDQVGLLLGSLTPSQKKICHERIAAGQIRFIVGTHALIAEKVDMHKLGLIIIDEQHRFGVEQRKKLQVKAGHMPHVLHMSATPIPRSIALTLYGELDITIIDELPANRKTIKTKIWAPNSRPQLNELIDKELSNGRQMFMVCPLILDTDISRGLSVEEVYKRVSLAEFKNRKVGLLHGKLSTDDKTKVMQAFIAREYDILVCTTVVEVGVDVPNASIMLIEGAERFGLAQIHQLRGRVGRAAHQSYCYLIPTDAKANTTRLKALENMSDGFKLAELDLELRGPGAIYGTFQHGALDLRVAKLSDHKLITSARKAAQEFIDQKEKLANYPYLNERVTALRAITNLN